MIGVRKPGGLDESHAQRTPALFAALGVQQQVAGDAEDPRPCVVIARRQLVQTSPSNQERIGNHVFGKVPVSTPLSEPPQIRVHHVIERDERALPIGIPCRRPHAPYLSATR